MQQLGMLSTICVLGHVHEFMQRTNVYDIEQHYRRSRRTVCPSTDVRLTLSARARPRADRLICRISQLQRSVKFTPNRLHHGFRHVALPHFQSWSAGRCSERRDVAESQTGHYHGRGHELHNGSRASMSRHEFKQAWRGSEQWVLGRE